MSDVVDAWIDGLVERHTAAWPRPDFLKAVRALSARYVEQRASLGHRSPLDSDGKRAAFAAFFAPLHFIVVRHIARELRVGETPVGEIIDLGCGTGVASAAWALELVPPPFLHGVDRSGWALSEAVSTWRPLGLAGRTTRGDLAEAMRVVAKPRKPPVGVMLGWAVNELEATSRRALLDQMEGHARAGVGVLIVEPLARSATPWWDEWVERLSAAGARSDVWKFAATLPPAIQRISDDAGFDHRTLGARSLWVAPTRR